MMEALAEAGLKVLSVGFESGSQKILKVLRKGLRVEDNFKASDVCRKYGIKIYGNYMFGVPGETPEDMMETARLIRHNRADVKGIGYYNPSPGSDLHDYCLKNGLCLKPGDYIRSMEPRIKGIDYHAAQKAIDYALSASLRQRILRRAAYVPALRKVRNAIKSIGPAESALKWLRNYVYNRN